MTDIANSFRRMYRYIDDVVSTYGFDDDGTYIKTIYGLYVTDELRQQWFNEDSDREWVLQIPDHPDYPDPVG